MKIKSSLVLVAIFACVSSARSEVKPNALFSNNAVLQQNAKVQARADGEKIECAGPEYDSFKVDKNKVVLRYRHVGAGLTAMDGPLIGFTMAGPPPPPSRGAAQTSIFVAAKAEIFGDTVVVSSDEVPLPVAVRYGWSDVPDGNLFNQEGLPASPFRTDP